MMKRLTVAVAKPLRARPIPFGTSLNEMLRNTNAEAIARDAIQGLQTT